MKRMVYMAVVALIAAAGIFWSCQKDETLSNPEEGLTLKKAVIQQSVDAFSWTDVCSGDDLTLKIEGSGQKQIRQWLFNETTQTYDWIQVSQSGNDDNPCTYTINNIEPGTYYFIYKLGNTWTPDQPGQTEMNEGFAVTVDPLPTAVLSGDATICSGSSVTLTVNLTGKAPWSITYSDGVTPVTLEPINSSSYTFEVAPTETTTYSLTNVHEISTLSCDGTVDGTASVTVEDCSSECEESFSYVENEDGTYTFTYIPGEDIPDAHLVFTFPQSSLDTPLAGWTYNGQTMQTTMSLEACETYTWTVTLTCKAVNNPQNKWTEFTVNNAPKKGTLSNIKCN